MKQHQEILQAAFDVLGCNTESVDPDYFIRDYWVEIDYDNDEINIYSQEDDDWCLTLKAIYPK